VKDMRIQAFDFKVHDNLEELSASVARRIAAHARQAIKARGVFNVALAGGETPRRCYERLREMPVEWKRVQVYFGDERCLPRGDAQRNDRMAYESLLGHVDIPSENVHVIPAERGASVAAAEYAALLEQAMPLDLVLLGLGEDGHVASLFFGNPAVERKELAVPVSNSPKPPPERVSLGLIALNAARAKLFLISGASKQDALEKVVLGIELPAARVKGAEWHVDRAALPATILHGK
jgi:6-phosphogluconolactonase